MIELDTIQSENNLTHLLDEKQLAMIGQQVVNGYRADEASREEWRDTVEQAMSIAKQIIEVKNTPWPNASNVKFPLITMAAIDFASRTIPEIIPNGNIVKVRVIGMDSDDSKYKRSMRVADFMSYQLSQESPDWEDGMDKLLQVLAVVGTAFKKTYYSELEKRFVSELCLPDKIVINHTVQSLETARRVTHVIELCQNDIISRQRQGMYNEDIDPKLLRPETYVGDDDDFSIDLLEQHCWLDLDDDGYKEPYIVTVHERSGSVLRIVSRVDSIKRNSRKEVYQIVPKQYFTDFHFIRSPDGGFYSMGFGSLLLPLNDSVNTIINQLIDAGTLNNMQGGFIGRGIRIKNGEFKIKMGEWKCVDTQSGANLAQNIFPMPTKEPSSTLFSLLGMLIQIGKDLSSTTDVMKGKQPAQNVATGTINTLMEQGTKIFGAINKRVYRSLKKEYTKIYAINRDNLDNKYYKSVLDDEEADVKKDFESENIDIAPVADPTMSSMAMRLNRGQIMSQLRTVNPRAVDTYILESMQLDKSQIDTLLPAPDPNAPPPPETQEIMAKIQLMQVQMQQIMSQIDLAQGENVLKAAKTKADTDMSKVLTQESIARVWKMQKDALHNDEKNKIVATKMQSEQVLKHDNADHSKLMDAVKSNLEAEAISVKDKKVKSDTAVSLAKIEADLQKNKEESSSKPQDVSDDNEE